MDLKETEILGDGIGKHWYYKSKALAAMRLLGDEPPSVVLDVGAGSGFFSRYLLAHGGAQEAWCVDIGYSVEHDGDEQGKPIHYRRSIERGNADTVLLMDVLEHVNDDVGLLAEYVGKVSSGARFLISVPAFQFLWSGHDEFLEHKRRYTLAQLDDVVKRAGLLPTKSAYYFGLVFPMAAAMRLASRCLGTGVGTASSQLKRHSAFANGTLALVCKAELPLMAINRLAGLTVFCMAERP